MSNTTSGDEARPYNGPMTHRSFHERRAIMGNSLDAALHAMSLAYTAKTATQRATLMQEAVMWSNLAVANAVEALATRVGG